MIDRYHIHQNESLQFDPFDCLECNLHYRLETTLKVRFYLLFSLVVSAMCTSGQ